MTSRETLVEARVRGQLRAVAARRRRVVALGRAVAVQVRQAGAAPARRVVALARQGALVKAAVAPRVLAAGAPAPLRTT